MSIERDSVDSTADGVRVNIRQNIEEQCYIPLSEKLLNSNNWYDEKELATGSEVTAEAHENRTVLELIQNARDAIRKASTDSASDVRDGSVAVVVGPERLYVANTGEPFHLDKEEVLERVRRLGMGKENDETIGEKGVGMRSILALGERFGVHSTITRGGSEETVSVEFSTAHPWAMLTRRYSDILASRDPELLDRITPSRSDTDHLDQYADCLDQVVEEMDTVSAESTILSANDDWPNAEAIMESMSNVGPPSPGDVIGGLPELSAFKYPLLRDGTSEDPIVRTLLGQHEGTIPPDDDLAGRLREDQYTTVVSVEYEDDARTQLLELFGETFGDAGAELDLPVEEWRQAASSDRSSADRRQEIWDECKETISREVLVLLGEIETIDLILLGDSAERKVTASERFRCNHRDSTVDNSDSGRDLQLRRLTVTHDERAASATSTAATAEFHLYTSEWEHAATDDDEDNRLRLLLEEPEERDDWRPAPHPLHLYYPIENETTPFPFILHAPFEVQRDRQSLDSDDEKNAALLADGALEEFLIETIAHIVNGESALQPWLPWLVMPLRGGDREPTSRNGYVSEFVDSVCTELSRSNCVPTFGGGSAPPGEVLLEVSGYRLDAFDPPPGVSRDPGLR